MCVSTGAGDQNVLPGSNKQLYCASECQTNCLLLFAVNEYNLA